jgi:uncharacterized membrane protein YgcG
MKSILRLTLFVLLFAASASAQTYHDIAPENGIVNDYVGLTAPEQQAAIKQKVFAAKQALGVEFGLAIVNRDDLAGHDVYEYQTELARRWGLGSLEGDHRAFMLLIAYSPVKGQTVIRLGPNRHIAGDFPDGKCGGLVRKGHDQFAKGDWAGGINTVMDATLEEASRLWTSPGDNSSPTPAPKSSGTGVILLLIAALFVGGTIWLVAARRRKSNREAALAAARERERRREEEQERQRDYDREQRRLRDRVIGRSSALDIPLDIPREPTRPPGWKAPSRSSSPPKHTTPLTDFRPGIPPLTPPSKRQAEPERPSTRSDDSWSTPSRAFDFTESKTETRTESSASRDDSDNTVSPSGSTDWGGDGSEDSV